MPKVEDIWRKNAKDVSEEYGAPDRFGFGNGSYFYDNCYGPNYYIQEQKRLKGIVEKMKPKPEKKQKAIESKALKHQIKEIQKLKGPKIIKRNKMMGKVEYFISKFK